MPATQLHALCQHFSSSPFIQGFLLGRKMLLGTLQNVIRVLYSAAEETQGLP